MLYEENSLQFSYYIMSPTLHKTLWIISFLQDAVYLWAGPSIERACLGLMLMNGDSTIHTSRLWSVSGFVICTNLQGFIYFLTNVKMCSKLNMLSWRLSLMFSLMEVVVWGLKLLCAVLPTSTSTHPALLPNFVVIWEIYIVFACSKNEYWWKI